MTIYASGGVIDFGGVIAFFVKDGRDPQNLAGTIGNAKTAALAAVFNHNDLSLPFFPGSIFILGIDLVFLCFLH
jgi:hypothetical protein